MAAPTESSSGRTQSKLQKLGNSPGLWIFLFAGFGLVCLSLGEEKIQNRMSRYHYKTVQQGGVRSIQGGDQKPRQVNSADTLNSPKSAPPYQYRLTGLRWILSIAAVGGFVSIVFTICKLKQTPTSSGLAKSSPQNFRKVK